MLSSELLVLCVVLQLIETTLFLGCPLLTGDDERFPTILGVVIVTRMFDDSVIDLSIVSDHFSLTFSSSFGESFWFDADSR